MSQMSPAVPRSSVVDTMRIFPGSALD
jgi:hypothetical protein